ncbi:hypothetical protein N8143_00200 [Pelagibacteraceae bacterium]|nr:hypothetical protein [Pelagibacteraceae bacterium]
MFKYIKKLTSVVVMFAVIIVFSSSNVYAEKVNQRNNPFLLLFFYVTAVDASIKNDAKILTDEQVDEIAKKLDDIVGITPFRKGKIQLSQKDMKEFFECIWNDETKKYELTARGKADFEKAKELSRTGGDGEGGGGHM